MRKELSAASGVWGRSILPSAEQPVLVLGGLDSFLAFEFSPSLLALTAARVGRC